MLGPPDTALGSGPGAGLPRTALNFWQTEPSDSKRNMGTSGKVGVLGSCYGLPPAAPQGAARAGLNVSVNYRLLKCKAVCAVEGGSWGACQW